MTNQEQMVAEAKEFQSTCHDCPPSIRPHKKGTHYFMRIPTVVRVSESNRARAHLRRLKEP
jgi:hypothetical protein